MSFPYKKALTRSSALSWLLVVIVAIGLTAGCGGGGGGGGGNDGDTNNTESLTYTGVTSKASINSANADDLAIGAFENGGSSRSLSLGVQVNNQHSGIGKPRVLFLTEAVQSVLNQAQVISPAGGSVVGAIVNESETIEGSCGGSVTVELSVDDTTGEFEGNFSFNDYCEADITINGTGNVESTESAGAFRMSFDSMTMALCDGSSSFTARGSYEVTALSGSTTIKGNEWTRDNSTGKVYRFENVVITTTNDSNSVGIRISGRFYHPDHGYATASTPEPLRIYTGDFWPTSGVFLLEGQVGAAGGSTKARMTAIDSANYMIEADTDGNGGYDFTEVKEWPDGVCGLIADNETADVGVEAPPSLNLKLPLPGNKSWLLTVEAGGKDLWGGQDIFHTGNGYFSLDFDNITKEDGLLTDVDVLAAGNGQVIESGGTEVNYCGTSTASWGYSVLIDHDVPFDGTGYTTRYAHLKNPPLVSVGEQVSQGEKIGILGNTGFSCPKYSDGHLHFQIYYNNSSNLLSELKGVLLDGLKIEEYTVGTTPSENYVYYLSTNKSNNNPSDEIVLQPGPEEGKDIWTTSVFSYAPGGGGPGGGLDNEWLQVGGWGDLYYTLIEFDLTGLPAVATSATLEFFVGKEKGNGTVGMHLDRITEFWNWRTQGTGSDFERLWWADRPSSVQWAIDLAPPTVGQWYRIDITDLYNAWQSGTYPNYGVQLRPVPGWNLWNEFYSSDYVDDPSLRPRLVIQTS